MIDIQVRNLIKAYDVNKNVLDGLSFDVNSGERVGILGANGAGKTTLFKILTGEIGYDEGEVVIGGGKKIGLISQIPVFPPDYTAEMVLRSAFDRQRRLAAEVEALEKRMQTQSSGALLRQYDELTAKFRLLGGYDTEHELAKVRNGLGIPETMLAQSFDSLSGGERTRVNLGRLLLEVTDILLLDEPTNHLDLKATSWLEDYLLKFKGTVLTISHDRYFLDRLVQRIIELDRGKAEFYSGNYSFYVLEKQARYEERLRKYEREQKEIARLEEASARLKSWGVGNKRLMTKAFAIDKRIERTRRTDRPGKVRAMKAGFGERDFRGAELLLIKGLSKSYGGRPLFSDLNLLVEAGERIAIIGDNGTGKSTLVKILLGEERADSGSFRFGPSVRPAYLPQIVSFPDSRRNLVDTLIYELDCTPQTARNRLGAFKFSGEEVFKTVDVLSGGEKSRLKLCMLMNEDINLLILDEPTNHLDISSREWIEEALSDYKGAIIFISHDRYFIQRFADRVWELKDQKITDYKCGFDEYLLKSQAGGRQPQAAERPKTEKTAKRPSRQRQGKEAEKEIKSLEREIAVLELEEAELDEAIEESASDYEALSQLMEEKERLSELCGQKLDRWAFLQEELEKAGGKDGAFPLEI